QRGKEGAQTEHCLKGIQECEPSLSRHHGSGAASQALLLRPPVVAACSPAARTARPRSVRTSSRTVRVSASSSITKTVGRLSAASIERTLSSLKWPSQTLGSAAVLLSRPWRQLHALVVFPGNGRRPTDVHLGRSHPPHARMTKRLLAEAITVGQLRDRARFPHAGSGSI